MWRSPGSSTRWRTCWRSRRPTLSVCAPTATPPARSTDLPHSLARMVDEGADLSELPGHRQGPRGKDCRDRQNGPARPPRRRGKAHARRLGELVALPGLGPKRVKALHEALKIATLEDLAAAPRRPGRCATLPGFSAETEEKILHEIERRAERQKRPCAAGHRAARRGPCWTISKRSRASARHHRRQLPAPARNGRRSRHPGHLRERRGGDRPFRRLRGCGRHRVQGHDAVDRHAEGRHPGRPACGPRRKLRRGAALFHRLEGAQHRGPAIAWQGRSRSTNTASLPERRTHRRPHRGRGLRAVGPALYPAGTARGSRRDRGGPQGGSCPSSSRSKRHPRRPARPHHGVRRQEHDLAKWPRRRRHAATTISAITDHSQHAPIAHGLDAKQACRSSSTRSTA